MGRNSRFLRRALVFLALAVVPPRTGLPAHPQPEPRAGAPSLEELAWLAGCWKGEDEGAVTEECWMAPAGGIMPGIHRDRYRPGKTSFEFFRIEAGPSGLIYQASPEGRPATPFTLVESGTKRVVFENPDHDFPQRVIYWLDGDGRLHARIEGVENGESRHSEWRWDRAPGACFAGD